MRTNNGATKELSQTTENPDVKPGTYTSSPWQTSNGHGNSKKGGRRYYVTVDEGGNWPPEIVDYNKRFTKLLQTIKHRHDPVVTTMGTRALRESIIRSHPHPHSARFADSTGS